MKKSKKAQLSTFIILGIFIVVIILAIFTYPKIKSLVTPKSPTDIISMNCAEEVVGDALNQTMKFGGILNPELYIRYNNQSIGYLCYTSEWYKTCVMQVPFLKETIENQIKAISQEKLNACTSAIENQLKSSGYDVKTSGNKTIDITIIPGKVLINLNMNMSVKKGEFSQTFTNARFKTEMNSDSYELIAIATSIQNYEARYGDSVPETYMSIYKNVKVEKKRQSDDSKVYILTNRKTNEVLQFAIRSLAWPPGFAPAVSFAGGGSY